MTDAVATLEREFPVWYKEVAIEADDPRRANRLEAIKQLAKDADKNLIEGLVRLAFCIDRQAPSSELVERVHESIRKNDSTFDASNSAREVQIIAGSCLVKIFSSTGITGDIAALSVTTASLGGARKPNLPMDLVALAKDALDRRSVSARTRPEIGEYSKTPNIKIGESWTSKTETEEIDDVDAADFATLAKEIQTAVRTITTQNARMVNSLEQFIKVQDEELQLLWWSIGGRSQDLDRDFSEIAASAQPLVLGKELADETYIPPGLRTVRALLARAGLREETKLTIPEVVNGSPRDWLARLTSDWVPSPVTQPIHFAIQRSLEVDDDKTWVDGWAGSSGLKGNKKLDVLTIGELVYREQLLYQFL